MTRRTRVALALIGLPLAAVGLLQARAASRAPISPEPVAGLGTTTDTEIADLAADLAGWIAVDTSNPPGPAAFPNAVGPDGREWPAWALHLHTRWAGPLNLPSTMLHGALVITVPGADDRPPVVLLNHADVVPAPSAYGWTWPPFQGVVADGYVWGRGAADNKAAVLCQLAAAARLTMTGQKPSRSVKIVVTPDEETDGRMAQALAADLGALGDPAAVIDEGSFFLPDFLPGVLVGAVAVTEKTFVRVDLRAEGRGGHASMPTGDSPADRIVTAIGRITAWDAGAAVPAPMIEAFRRLAPHRAWPESLALANGDLLAPALLGTVARTAAGRAITRDTVALTLLDAGVKDNMIPTEASATLNARLRAETEVDRWTEALRATVDDGQVAVEVTSWPSRARTSDWDHEVFHAIERAIVSVEPESVPVPSATPGTMDARAFSAVGVPAYRFHPFVMDADERARIHGVDERLSVENLGRGVRFYEALMRAL